MLNFTTELICSLFFFFLSCYAFKDAGKERKREINLNINVFAIIKQEKNMCVSFLG
jgi:hypothetical protein